jgi:uncharacterized protein (TIGR02270 family)
MQANHGLISRHVEDVAFLWARRQRALRSNQLTHAERIDLDARVDAHVDGLLLAGQMGWRVCLEQLELRRDAESTFAAMVVALREARSERCERVLSLAENEPDNFAAMVSAIGWTDLSALESRLERWSVSSSASESALGIAGLASHRRSSGAALVSALRDESSALRGAAAKAVGDLGEPEHSEPLRNLLTDKDPTVRFQAARTLARLRDADASVSDVLLAASESTGPLAGRAVAALVALAPRDGVSLFRCWARNESSRRLALVVAETLGNRELVEDIIPWMDDDVIARSAGDAFRTITGADLRLQALSRPRPDHVPGEPTDDPDDTSVELPADYELPFPSAEKVAAWWSREAQRFEANTRYLDGKPIGTSDGSLAPEYLDNLRALVRTGRPRHQTLAARAMAQIRAAIPSIETHAFATRKHALPGWDANSELP